MSVQNDSSDKLEARVSALGTEWARLPKAGARLEGLARTYLYDLIETGKIPSHVIKKPHCERGIRLIHLPSLRAFIGAAAAAKP